MNTYRQFPVVLPRSQREPLVDALLALDDWASQRYRLSIGQRVEMFGRHARNVDGVFREFPFLGVGK